MTSSKNSWKKHKIINSKSSAHTTGNGSSMIVAGPSGNKSYAEGTGTSGTSSSHSVNENSW